MGTLRNAMVGLLVFMVMIGLSASFLGNLADKNNGPTPGDKLQMFNRTSGLMETSKQLKSDAGTQEPSDITGIAKFFTMALDVGKTFLQLPLVFNTVINDAVILLELPHATVTLLYGIIFTTIILGVIKLVIG